MGRGGAGGPAWSGSCQSNILLKSVLYKFTKMFGLKFIPIHVCNFLVTILSRRKRIEKEPTDLNLKFLFIKDRASPREKRLLGQAGQRWIFFSVWQTRQPAVGCVCSTIELQGDKGL